MADYKHGTYQKETATDLITPVILPYGYFIVGTAPMNQVAEEDRSVNVVQRIATPAQATQYFGGTYDFDFSISQAVEVFFKLYRIAPIYAVNVLDVSKHKTNKTDAAVEVVNDEFLIPSHKVIPETLKVKNNADSLPITDFLTSWGEDGLTVIVSGAEKVDIEYDVIDISKVTKDDIIGGYDLNTMQRKGLELADEVFMKFQELPAFIDAPDYSYESDVAAVLETKANNLNGGMFEAIPLINAPLDKKYDEIPMWKNDNNITDENMAVLYGAIKLSGKVYHHSIHYAALSLSVDNDNNGVPSITASNKAYKMDALVWKKGSELEEIRLDREQEANFLNRNGVITAINFTGWRCWGSETAKNPMATDPKDKFLYTRRMFKWIGNELVITYFNTVDAKFDAKLAETVMRSINIRLGGLKGSGDLLGAEVVISGEDNTVLSFESGDINFRVKLGIVPHAKSLTFIKQIDANYLENYLNSLTS